MDDDELMRRAVAGDNKAFEAIVKAHQRTLTCFAERLLAGDTQSAHDVVQEAFVRLWQMRRVYKPQGCLRSLLYRVVHNGCLDIMRRTRPFTPLVLVSERAASSTQSPNAICQARALYDAIQLAVQALPKPQKVVFILSQYERLSYPQIAAILDCPVGTVASRKRLAVEALRRKLGGWMDNNS